MKSFDGMYDLLKVELLTYLHLRHLRKKALEKWKEVIYDGTFMSR
jgi:hypothetical protein